MGAKSVGFAVADEDMPLLDELVNEFGDGNRSEFLREAMRVMRHQMRAERLRALHTETKEALGGRLLTRAEVDELIGRTSPANA
jgi:Arc/MetJ-type ribon-helix-helix transcriptional regulator